MLKGLFSARSRYGMIDSSVDRARGVFTKTINKLTMANDKLGTMVAELDDEIAEREQVRSMAKDKVESNNRMIDKINGLLD